MKRVSRWNFLVAAFLSVLLGVAVLRPTTALASLETDILERWYVLLGQANSAGLGGLLAPRAKIKLDDLGLTQTKQEFLDSMAEWSNAIEDGRIRYKIDTTTAGGATATVCYEFKSNELMTRERFRFVNGLITESEQVKIAESCSSFAN